MKHSIEMFFFFFLFFRSIRVDYLSLWKDAHANIFNKYNNKLVKGIRNLARHSIIEFTKHKTHRKDVRMVHIQLMLIASLAIGILLDK